MLAGTRTALALQARAACCFAEQYFVGDGKNPVHLRAGMFEATVGNALFTNRIVTLDFHAVTIDVRSAAE